MQGKMKGIMELQGDLRQWIGRAQAGDRGALDWLFQQHRGPLEAIVRRRLGRHLRQEIEVEDVLQETFLKAMQSIGSYRDQGQDSFLNWLRGIAENLLLYWARQHQRARCIPMDREVGKSCTPPSREMRREERFERLQEVLSQLSPEHREVILMARVEGIPTQEIARRLGRSAAAVKQLLWRAIQKLGDRFGETESLHLPQRSLLDPEDGRAGKGGKDA
jgi:RNA polymerase sigma-70 factor (ECF subfamily)